MANFITAQELKAYPLPVSSKQWENIGDDKIDTVIGYASDHLEDYLDREIGIATYSQRTRAGSGTSKQLLGLYPFVTLNTVTSYDNKGTATVWDNALFYVNPDSAIIEWLDRSRYAFTKSSIWVFNYDAGYATVPGPIKHATALQTIKQLQPIFRGGSNFAEVELIDELDEQIVEQLETYKRRRIG